MDDLSQVLTSVIDKIKKFRSLYEQNEMAVRDHIINPILKSLGWDPENPEDVRPNVSTEEGVPDYSLIKNGKTILFVEVKKLSVEIERREFISQLGKYCYSEGKKFGVLTNGSLWVLFRSFEEGTTLTERIVWKTDLEKEEPLAISRKITTISKNNIEQIELLVKKVQVLDEAWKSLLKEPADIVKGLMPVVKSLISQRYQNYQFEDPEIEDLLKEKVKEIISGTSEGEAPYDILTESAPGSGESPQKMKLKGETFNLRNSFEILVNTANWLIKNGKLKTSDCPVVIGRGKRCLINRQAKHPDHSDFRAPKPLSNGLSIETHIGTKGAIDYARRLLEKFGVSPNILTIE
jgi:hypothetical protein